MERKAPEAMKWETVIGLEIHAQLLTETKLFCSCPVSYGEKPNTFTCPVCLGLPGSLPVLNEKAFELATRAALALNCRINKTSVFARKNYFYPDLPKGYQISQFDKPLAENGFTEIETEEGTKRIGIVRIHIEEDAGKLIHEGKDTFSRIDYNRSSLPLIEIVSRPELSSPGEAALYLKKLREILIDNRICDGNMERGNLRCDANVSIREKGEKGLRTKTELKNMNSVNFIEKALEYEIKRQSSLYEQGSTVSQQTLLFDPKSGETQPMRSKEEAHDYRYFEEPDLLPLVVQKGFIEKINSYFIIRLQKLINIFSAYTKESKPPGELEEIRDKERLRSSPYITQNKIKKYEAGISEHKKRAEQNRILWYKKLGVSADQAVTIVNFTKIDEFFIKEASLQKNALNSATLLTGVLIPKIKETEIEEEQLDRFLSYLKKTVGELDCNRINLNTARDILSKAIEGNKDPLELIRSGGLTQINDSSRIDEIIDQVINSFPDETAQYRKGKEPLFNFLFGQVMKLSKGKVNPKLATKRLREKLKL